MNSKNRNILLNATVAVVVVGCCLFVAAVSMCLVILADRPPHISIQQLHIREDSNTTSFVVDLKFKDVNNVFLYSDLNITLYCVSDQSFSVLGYCVIPGFYQYWWNTTVHQEAVVVPRGPPWDDARRKIGQGSTVGLRVEMTTNFRRCGNSESINCLYMEPKALAVDAGFLLDASGQVLKIH